MPNLKKLDLFTSAYYEFYMTILASQGNKYLRCIEDISIHAAYHELHFTVCYQFRHTLTHLEVYFATYCVNHLFGDPLYFLPHFKHLTNITLKNFERRDLTLFDILGICPHLTVLDFDSNFDVSDQIVNLSFKNMLVDNMIDIRPNVILHSHLQILDLTLPKLSNGYIRYLTHYTDMKQLHTLSITLFDSHFDDWIKLNSVDTVTDFIGRLSKVTHLQFCTRFVSRDGSLDELVEANCFQEFLDAVQVSQPVYYETYSNQLTY
ncbi:hypothetical protein INT48_000549 [Thamnidium elegans]|uniref:Uncharacterized protein n=1 Tax=Thamnidium elegans TaxID=101142 RepID=A0A8H7SV00_9FUNG|nr:hypothetical protein INT48_000549 [Thamnidium elegans]